MRQGESSLPLRELEREELTSIKQIPVYDTV